MFRLKGLVRALMESIFQLYISRSANSAMCVIFSESSSLVAYCTIHAADDVELWSHGNLALLAQSCLCRASGWWLAPSPQKTAVNTCQASLIRRGFVDFILLPREASQPHHPALLANF